MRESPSEACEVVLDDQQNDIDHDSSTEDVDGAHVGQTQASCLNKNPHLAKLVPINHKPVDHIAQDGAVEPDAQHVHGRVEPDVLLEVVETALDGDAAGPDCPKDEEVVDNGAQGESLCLFALLLAFVDHPQHEPYSRNNNQSQQVSIAYMQICVEHGEGFGDGLRGVAYPLTKKLVQPGQLGHHEPSTVEQVLQVDGVQHESRRLHRCDLGQYVAHLLRLRHGEHSLH